MEVVIALILVLAAGWFLMSLFFVRQKTTQQESHKAKHQKPTPNSYKRVPVIPSKRGTSDLQMSAIKYAEGNQTKDIPLVSNNDLNVDEYLDLRINKTYGEVLGLLVPDTLVDGKQTWEFAHEAKNDLQRMLECCRAELEGMRAVGQFPAPFYFTRAAIIFRKQKMYFKEIEIIEFYWRAVDEVARKNNNLSSQQAKALKKGFEHRYAKAKMLLAKQNTDLF